MVDKDDSIYAPSHDRGGFDARLDDGGRGPLLLIVSVALLLAFIAVVYTAYHQGLRKGGRDAAPLISAEPGPIKVRPANNDKTAGRPTPNLDNRAYEPLDDVQAVPADKVTTAPLPEAPLARPVVKPAGPAQNTATNPPVTVARKETPPARKTIAKPKPKPTASPVATTGPAVSAAPAATPGDFVVQIAAFRSEDQALTAWAGLANRLSAVTSNLSPDIQRADLGERGVFYRLRAASFASREAAKAACDQLKAGGQDCLVVRR